MSNLITEISNAIQALHNCELNPDAGKMSKWVNHWRGKLDEFEKQLPRGSGIDCGTKIILDDKDKAHAASVIRLLVEFHHMDDNGMYCGWRSYTIVARAMFGGIDIEIKGRDPYMIKEYLSDVFYSALTADVEHPS